MPYCVSSAQAPDRLASAKRRESLTPCGDTKNAAGLRFPLHFSTAAERQPCLPLPPAAAGLPSPSAAPPLPIKAGALMGTLVLTIYVHYALRSPPCLKQFKTRKSLSAFYRVSVLSVFRSGQRVQPMRRQQEPRALWGDSRFLSVQTMILLRFDASFFSLAFPPPGGPGLCRQR